MPTENTPVSMTPSSTALHAARAADYNATVAHRTEVAPGLMILRIVLDASPFPFTAGQYVVLGLKASAPRVAGTDDDPEGYPTSAGGGAVCPRRPARRPAPRRSRDAGRLLARVFVRHETEGSTSTIPCPGCGGRGRFDTNLIRRALHAVNRSRARGP